MAGRVITLPGVSFVASDAPLLVTTDPIESAGSLYLVDCTHPAGAWPSGVPASGDTVPNLFGSTLSGLSSGAVDPTIVIGGTIDDAIIGSIERTGKGGLHVIVSQAHALSLGDGVKITMPSALEAYLASHTSHHYYLSVWDRLTRAQGANADACWTVSTTNTSTNSGIAVGYVVAFGTPVGVNRLNQDILDNVLGPRFGNVATDACAGSVTNNKTAGPIWGAPIDGVGSTALSNRNGKWPSAAFYRCYIEDLTVSGRTYAEVHAIDTTLFADLVLTPGGRYYGDTWTSPSEIP